jgi:hypothetical protein
MIHGYRAVDRLALAAAAAMIVAAVIVTSGGSKTKRALDHVLESGADQKLEDKAQKLRGHSLRRAHGATFTQTA